MSEINKIDINDYKVETIKLSNNDGGGFLATVPKLPGCMSDGETPEEALVNVKDAITCWIETARKLGRKVPEPDKSPLGAEVSYIVASVTKKMIGVHLILPPHLKIFYQPHFFCIYAIR